LPVGSGISLHMAHEMPPNSRMQCTDCGCQTLTSSCGNCGATELRPVKPSVGDRLDAMGRSHLLAYRAAALMSPPGRQPTLR
jgi:hypothetical protein